MTVYIDDAKYHVVHDGVDHWFCAASCLRAFSRDLKGSAPEVGGADR
jgi:YHS domain-containing protein